MEAFVDAYGGGNEEPTSTFLILAKICGERDIT